MPFRLDKAASTLRAALDALAEVWPELDSDVQQQVIAVMRRYSRDVIQGASGMWANGIIGFLQGLWDLSAVLPGPVVQALAAGQGLAPRPVFAIDDATRSALTASILRVVDPRYYRDALALAAEVSDIITRNQDRLTPSEHATWAGLDQAYQVDPGHQAENYLRRAEQLLGHYPALARVLEDGKTWVQLQGGAPGVASRPSSSLVAPGSNGAGDSGPMDLQRYANVHFPACVLMGQQMVPLIVHIAPDYNQAGSVAAEDVRLAVQAGELTLLLHAEDFLIASAIGGRAVPGAPAARMVSVVPEHDCEPVIFFLNPRAVGAKRLSIDIYQFDRVLATLSFVAIVVDQAAASDLGSVQVPPMPLAAPTQGARPPDLELRVTLGADGRTLAFLLHSPQGREYNFKPAGQVTLQTDPRNFLQRYVDRLGSLARISAETRTPGDTQQALRELSRLGANLYDDLFPADLKQEYRTIRARYRGQSLLITSDEPWIPWELVRPFESDEAGSVLYDDPFLCETFRLSHWLAGRGTPDRLVFKQAAVIVPAGNLPAAQQEADYFEQLYRQQWDIQVKGPLTSVAEVEDCLEDGQTQLYHFACHGNFDTQNPDESRLKLADGSWQPSAIAGTTVGALRRAKPLVFLNACYSGDIGFTLTGLGGWAERLVQAGVSAFIGTLWEINDRLAAQFATEFYNRLWGLSGRPPLPLGEAFLQARLAIKQLDPANPTWLAYVLYGDPYGDIPLGQR
jgi:hypothetical protein